MVLPPVAFIAGCGAAVFSLLPRENLHVGYLCFRPTARLLCLFFVASLLPRENVHVGYPEAWVPRSRDTVFFLRYLWWLSGWVVSSLLPRENRHVVLGKTGSSTVAPTGGRCWGGGGCPNARITCTRRVLPSGGVAAGLPDHM